MALSGSFATTAYSNRNLVFNWNATQSVSGNYSIINWSLVGSGSASGYYKAAPFTVVIDGEQVYYSDTRIQLRNGTIVATGSKVIYHHADGSRNFSASVSAAIYSYAVNVSGSGSWSLDSIPRAATITSAPDFTDEDNPTITYSNLAGSLVTSLQACISLTGSRDDVPYRDIPIDGTSYQFVLTEEERDILRNATPDAISRTVIFYIRTEMEDATYYSTLQKTFTISDDVTPSAIVSISDTEGHFEKYGKYVQGKSKLHVLINAEGVYGSTIKSYKTTFDGKTYTEAEFTTDVIAGKDTLELEVVVTDSRGRICTVKESIQVYEYNPPKIISIKAKRCQAHNVNEIGEDYLGVLFSSEVTALDGQNTVVYKLDYKKTTESTYTTILLDDYTNQHEVDGNAIFAADNDTYNIILRITDDFGSSEKKINGPSISVLVSKLKYNLGMAFGKLAELVGVLDIGFKTRFFGGILYMVLEDGSKADEVLTPNRYLVKSKHAYEGFPEADVEAVLDVVGDEEIIKQTFSITDKEESRKYERVYTYEDETWSSWSLVNAPYGFIAGDIPTAVTVQGYSTIPFVEKEKCGSYFELQNGIITIGKNVTYVRVSAAIGGSAVSGRCWAHLKHADTSHNNISRSDAIQYGTYVSPYLSDIIRVNEGDQLSIYTIEEFTPKSGGVDCYIYVERMK